MKFLDWLMSSKKVDIRQDLTKVKELLFAPNKTSKRLREHYPNKIMFKVYRLKKRYTAYLKVWYVIKSLTDNGYQYVEKEIELTSFPKENSNLAKYNKLYRETIKAFNKQAKEKGFNECLLEHYYVAESRACSDLFILDIDMNTIIANKYKASV